MAAFLLLFGPDGAIMLDYNFFPTDQPMWLFAAYPRTVFTLTCRTKRSSH
jgi:hypothetical protein